MGERTFTIRRASDFLAEGPPVEGAVRSGEDWVIHIPDLDAMMELRARVGDIVLGTNDILIYDDYIE